MVICWLLYRCLLKQHVSATVLGYPPPMLCVHAQNRKRDWEVHSEHGLNIVRVHKPWTIELIDKWKYIQWKGKYILGWENICAKVCQHLAFGGLETTLSKFEHRLLATTVAKKPRTETKIWIFPKMWITYKHIYMYVIVLYSLSIATTGGKNADRETKICQNVTTNMLNRMLWKWI